MFLKLATVFLSVSVLFFVVGLRCRGSSWRKDAAHSGVALLVMLALTAIFDNLMIAAGLFDYGQHTLSGARIGLAPIEDFLYAACAVFFMAGLWWCATSNPKQLAVNSEKS